MCFRVYRLFRRFNGLYLVYGEWYRLFGVWYELLHRSSMNVIGQQRLKELMNRFSSGFLGRRVRTIVAISIVLVDRFSKVLFWFVEHSSFFGSTLAKNTIENAGKDVGESFDTAQWDLDWSLCFATFCERNPKRYTRCSYRI